MPDSAAPATRGGQIVVLLNPAAGRKPGIGTGGAADAADLRALFGGAGLDAQIVATESTADAVERARAARAAGVGVIVAAGGDGTVEVIARELIDREGMGPVLGIVPLGSVMNFARSLGIERNVEVAVDAIARGEVRRIDVGTVNGEPFFEGTAIGLQAALFRVGDQVQRGSLGAILRWIWVALRYQPARMSIDLGDRTITTRALVVSVANGPYTGIAFTVAPEARLDDGRLDVRVFERFSRWELLRHFGSIVAGRRRYEPRVRTYRSRLVRITSVSPLPVRADGRPVGHTPVEIGVWPGALRVVAPKQGAAPAVSRRPPPR